MTWRRPLSIGHRIAISFVIALTILFALALYGWLTGRWEQDQASVPFELESFQSKPATPRLTLTDQLAQLGRAAAQTPIADPYAGIPPDTRLLALDKRALEEAYHMRLVRLFDVWLSSTQGQDETAFSNGLRIARQGYIKAAAALAKREREIELQIGPQQQPQLEQRK